MKVLALHLPQFHEIPENNYWWGGGFTEWTNVKKSKPLYPGHIQPILPLEGYYDLSQIDAINHQAILAKKYNVYGFVYFHYWFKGKKLLQKPIELLLKNPQVIINYCLCWANHSWTRSWDGKEKQVLLKQTYGKKEDWNAHLDYLMPFFKDDRYIKHNGKPLLFIYNPSVIPYVDEMIFSWENRCRTEGFDGLYIVEYISTKNTSPNIKVSSAVYEDEPFYSLRFETNIRKKLYRLIKKKLNQIELQDFDEIYAMILKKRRTYDGRAIIQGCFPTWDNSPRRGNRGPTIVTGSSPDKFECYFQQLLKSKRKDISQDYIVINAWNEWGEGAVLEPSEKYGYSYLEAIKRSLYSNLSGEKPV